MMSETKVDDSFPNGQVFLDGFGIPFHLNLNRNGDGIIISIRNNISQKKKKKKNHLLQRINLTEGEINSLLTNCRRSCKRTE